MLKKMSIRKITVTTFALLIMGLFYFFPTRDYKVDIEPTITYEEKLNLKNVYLMDKYDFVSKLRLPIVSDDIYDIIKEKIDYLTINSKKIDDIPNGFRPIIPDGTKIIGLNLNEGILTINFSKELLDIPLDDEESMIEAIIYTLTDMSEIKGITIKVEGNILDSLPQSKKPIKYPLNREYGINKIYDFDTLSNLTKTVVYYINIIGDETYYTPVTKVSNDNREKITVIIDELKGSLIFQSNLSSYLSSTTELKDYEIIEKTMHLTFNDKIFNSLNTKNILEEVKYTISMSIKENYDLEKVVFYVDEEEVTSMTLKTLE